MFFPLVCLFVICYWCCSKNANLNFCMGERFQWKPKILLVSAKIFKGIDLQSGKHLKGYSGIRKHCITSTSNTCGRKMAMLSNFLLRRISLTSLLNYKIFWQRSGSTLIGIHKEVELTFVWIKFWFSKRWINS